MVFLIIMLRKSVCITLIIGLFFSPLGAYPSALSYLPSPGTLLTVTPVSRPLLLCGLKVDKDNPFHFTLLLRNAGVKFHERELARLIRYFLTALTMPEESFWVNLSPDEPYRVFDDRLVSTEMGRDMLGADYLLKQLAASLTYPNTSQGKAYWAGGTAASDCQKIWIVPDKAKIYADGQRLMISEASLRLMMENSNPAFETNIIPMLTDEVNHGKYFDRLRQIYTVLLLAAWYKSKCCGNALYQGYVDQEKIYGVNVVDASVRTNVYAQYVASFEKGAYDLKRREGIGRVVTRRYFSGGFNAAEGEHAASSVVARDIAAWGPDAQEEWDSSSVADVVVYPVSRQYYKKAGRPLRQEKPIDIFDEKKHIAVSENGFIAWDIPDAKNNAAIVKDALGSCDYAGQTKVCKGILFTAVRRASKLVWAFNGKNKEEAIKRFSLNVPALRYDGKKHVAVAHNDFNDIYIGGTRKAKIVQDKIDLAWRAKNGDISPKPGDTIVCEDIIFTYAKRGQSAFIWTFTRDKKTVRKVEKRFFPGHSAFVIHPNKKVAVSQGGFKYVYSNYPACAAFLNEKLNGIFGRKPGMEDLGKTVEYGGVTFTVLLNVHPVWSFNNNKETIEKVAKANDFNLFNISVDIDFNCMVAMTGNGLTGWFPNPKIRARAIRVFFGDPTGREGTVVYSNAGIPFISLHCGIRTDWYAFVDDMPGIGEDFFSEVMAKYNGGVDFNRITDKLGVPGGDIVRGDISASRDFEGLTFKITKPCYTFNDK